MANYYGNVGFGTTVEVSKGVFEDKIVEHKLSGEIVRDSYRHKEGTDKVNPDTVLVNTFRLLADGYAEQNFLAIRYIEYQGIKWKAQSIQYERPRITVTVGEVWNGSRNQLL